MAPEPANGSIAVLLKVSAQETCLTFYAVLRDFRVALRSGRRLTVDEADLLATTLEMFEDYVKQPHCRERERGCEPNA